MTKFEPVKQSNFTSLAQRILEEILNMATAGIVLEKLNHILFRHSSHNQFDFKDLGVGYSYFTQFINDNVTQIRNYPNDQGDISDVLIYYCQGHMKRSFYLTDGRFTASFRLNIDNLSQGIEGTSAATSNFIYRNSHRIRIQLKGDHFDILPPLNR